MKKRIGWIACLLLVLPLCASAQEYYTLPEIREQAVQGWHETYTDEYGRQTEVNIPVQVFGENTAPVVKVRPSRLEADSQSLEEGASIADQTIYKNNPADDVFGAKSGQVTMTVYHTFGEEIDMDTIYGEEYGASLTMRRLKERASTVLAAQGISLDSFLFDQPKEFSVRCKMNTKTQEVVASAAYLAHFWQMMYGMPIFDSVNSAYERTTWPRFAPQLQVTMRKDDEYSITLWAVEETELLAQDIPLCSWEKIQSGLEEKIESGHIQKLYSARLGYVVYNDPNNPKDLPSMFDADGYYLVPTWVVECIYMDKPKQTWSYSGKQPDELSDNEKTGVGYRIVMINAQTGEMMDYFDTSLYGRGDARYKGFISWEDVR